MFTSFRAIAQRGIVCLAAAAAATPAFAQNEASLKSFFEGRRVTVKLDMPGTSDGVDVEADARQPIDYPTYRDNLKRYGTALRAGESVTVTLVKMKKDLIEFQLAGGGFGTFADDTSTSVYMPEVKKSEREKELERLVKDEDDRDRRRRFERELDDLRDRRERENRRIDIARERAEDDKKALVAERRLRGGSRFNLRYDGHVPDGMRPEDVMAALNDYVDFGGLAVQIDVDEVAAHAGVTLLRKGMTRVDAERTLGRPETTSNRSDGGLAVTTLVFVVADQRVSADFVEDVLVRYTITSK